MYLSTDLGSSVVSTSYLFYSSPRIGDSGGVVILSLSLLSETTSNPLTGRGDEFLKNPVLGVLGRVDRADVGLMLDRAFGVVALLSRREEEAEVVRSEGPVRELRDFDYLTASVELLSLELSSKRGLFPPLCSPILYLSLDMRERKIFAV